MDGVKKKILIVDDDEEFDARLAEKISLSGMQPVVTVSGEEALSYIQSHDVDFIILDFIMPEMDGFKFYHTLTRDLRKVIPTVVLTNLTHVDDSEGLDVYVKSQTSLDEFVGMIEKRLG